MKINSRAALTASCVALVCCLAYANASAGLILYTTLEDAGAIQRPEVAITDFETLSEAVPGLEHVSFEPGRVGTAARVDATGFYNSIGSADGPFRIHGDNIDFADPDKDGGRLDIWVRFDEDPHATTANTWLARSNYGVSRYVNYEWSSSGGTADMMIDMYSDITQNHRTSPSSGGTTAVNTRTRSICSSTVLKLAARVAATSTATCRRQRMG
jgi:hypothetical protein